jgi:predicted CopG family antitoxin
MPQTPAQKRSDMSFGDLISKIADIRKQQLLSTRTAIKDNLAESNLTDYDVRQEKRRERSQDA